jgi:hypothetical protein
MAIPGGANAALKLSFSSCLLAPRNGIGAHIIAQHTDAALALEHRTVDALREQELQGCPYSSDTRSPASTTILLHQHSTDYGARISSFCR